MTSDQGTPLESPADQPAPPGPPRAAPAAAAGVAGAPVRLEQTFDADSLYALRSAAAAHAADAGLPPSRVYDVVGAVHELAANAIRHGAGHGRLLIWASQGALHCQVSDDGTAGGGGTAAARGSGDGAGFRVEYGHGLWLIRQFTPEISVHTGPEGTTVTASFALDERGPEEG